MTASVEAAVLQPALQRVDGEFDDLREVVLGERLEDHDVVEPVDELGLERLAHQHLQACSRFCSDDSVGSMRIGEPRFDVRIRITFLKSTVRPWPSVRRPSSMHLQQHVEDLGVRLLDLVEQHDAVRAPAHGLGELAALLVADVAGRGADEPRDGVLLAVLRHVDAHHGVLVVEEELGERLRELGLADAGRAEEQERAGRPVRVADAGARAAHGIRDRLDGLLLPDQALAELGLEVQQLLGLALQEPADRDAGPRRDDGGDVFVGDLVVDHARLAGGSSPLGRRRAGARAPGCLVQEPRRLLEVALALRALGLDARGVELAS